MIFKKSQRIVLYKIIEQYFIIVAFHCFSFFLKKKELNIFRIVSGTHFFRNPEKVLIIQALKNQKCQNFHNVGAG